MATPMTAKQFVDLLNKWGIPHEENRPGWENHNRNSKGEWGPINGVGNHHTGGGDNQDGADILWNGYGALPGPLCHAGIRQNGKVLLNGWGRVNHFGLGDDDTLRHVINEDYVGTLKPNEANTDGNTHFYGFEWMYSGTVDPETIYPKMYQTAVRVNAAICTWHKWTDLSCIGHGEWQPGKWDPGYSAGKMMSMTRFRNHVNQAIHEGPPKTKKVHTVVVGETLPKIAVKYNVTLAALVKANPQLVKAGDKLIIPT